MTLNYKKHKTRQKQSALVLACLFSIWAVLPLSGQEVIDRACEKEMIKVSQKYRVPLPVLYAVGLTESGGKEGLKAYALNVEGTPFWETSPQAAINRIQKALQGGKKLIDIGCMQINHLYHRAQFTSLADMLAPPRNVAYAAQFLNQLYQQEKSWTLAVARYHASPKNTMAQKKYLCRVIVHMVKSGFGGWTKNAKAFCAQETE